MGRARFAAVAAVMVSVVMVFALDCAEAAKNVDCTEEVERMQPCLGFVESQTNIPSSDCCKSLLYVHLNSPVCLCKLLSSSTSSSTQIIGVNITNALLLPKICNVHTNAARCPALLQGSPEPSPGTGAAAKVSAENASSGKPKLDSALSFWILLAVGSSIVFQMR